MRFRPPIPLRLLLPQLWRRPSLPPVHLPRPISSYPSAAAVAAATDSEEDPSVARDPRLAPHFVGGAGGSPRFGENKAEFERKASIAARFKLCYELLRQRRRREMRGGLAQVVSEQGSGSAAILCDILWSEFREYDSSGVVWDALANSYARSKMVHDALYVLSKMNSLNMQISVSTYDSLLYGLRMTDMALELFDEMEAYGISHSEYSHSILIDGLCKQNKVGEALSFLQEAREGGMFRPLGMSFNTLMSALCNWGFIQPAKSFLCLMMKYGLNPNRYTYSTLIHGLCKVGCLDEAVDLLERVTKEGMKLETVTYNSLINGYRLLGLTREIPKIIQFMRYQGIEPDLVTYTILIAGHCEGGDVEEGMKIRKDILDKGLQLNIVTYSVLLNALFKKGLVYEVENLLGEIYSIGLDMDVIAYSILIHGYCKLGEIERALEVCDVMCCSQKVVPTSLNHLSILLGLCKKGLLVEARWYLENVASRYQPGDVILYNVVIDGYAKVGDIGNAVRLYDQIVVAGMNPTIITCNSLLYGYCKFGDLHAAESYFRAIEISNLLPTAVTYTTIMDALSEAGKVNTMLSFFYEMVEKGIKPNAVTYSVVIKGLCKQLRFRDAIHFLDNMDGADPITYNTLIQGFCEAQDIQMAFCMHDRMLCCGLVPTPVTYNLLINVLCLKGKVIQAEMLLESLREKGIELRKFAYTTIIKAQCAKGMPYDAISLVGKLIDDGFETSIEDFSAAINRLCKRKFPKEAVMFIPIMLSVGVFPDTQVYFVLVKALQKSNMLCHIPILHALSVKTGI
ncbi:putative pentatricopeptide repeat-containing protein At1g13630 isoform X1 [Triticum dicoccoides]|uniref:putative pentatricopeptide repeat-containing protein At1g13630 isoform X1 n=1 Tax=Triticum dicoccoides TaxID=85692 RepID=UPI00188F904C|nr:putative pentatricopeptide repeat-containing protein At1g13630 isoform X1 [Triticum dicoccoides]